MNHFTDAAGYDAIGSQTTWTFHARQPPGEHPLGAYFTTLDPTTPNLAARLRIPRSKIAFVFSFVDLGDLVALRGGRGKYVFYSPVDYRVHPDRQHGKGPTGS